MTISVRWLGIDYGIWRNFGPFAVNQNFNSGATQTCASGTAILVIAAFIAGARLAESFVPVVKYAMTPTVVAVMLLRCCC